MNTVELSADPYEGARRAFFVLDPSATDEGWSHWISKYTDDAVNSFDSFTALSGICRKAAEILPDSEGEIHKLIAFALGYFEAMELVTSAAWTAQPTSAHVPKHFERQRLKLVNRETQFEW